MKRIVFDGKSFASKKEEILKREIGFLRKNGIHPQLISILIGNNKASKTYLSLKKKFAERIGVEMGIINFSDRETSKKIIDEIKKLNDDKSVHGIMVQLPLPNGLKKEEIKILSAIVKEKDVDGLRRNSKFVPATVKAIIEIVDLAKKLTKKTFNKTLVVGATGMVGRPLVKELVKSGHSVIALDLRTKDNQKKILEGDLVISATGEAGLITGEMIKPGAVVVDVGSPKGDVDFEEVKKKASFITPVPGGVGPVTIVSLFENLLSTVKFAKY